MSDKRGLDNGFNLYKPCSFNQHLIVVDDTWIPCLFINVDILAEELVLCFLAIVTMFISSLSEVFLFRPVPALSCTSPVS